MPFPRSCLAGLCALALAGPARAADFDGVHLPPRPDHGGYEDREPLPEPAFRRPHFTAGPNYEPAPEPCRVFVRRRIDAFGEAVVRRVRVCDEPAGYAEGRPRRPVFLDGPPAGIPDGWGGPRW
ncbi:hypothetical protein [uncultured Methylobacterium sp.]|uniref:hypothetical protein n=1 Tax=uncultured Methylobacterium sp. TaxID=157278 RepID=UPI0035C9DF33